MTPLTRRIIFIALVICTAQPAWSLQNLLYTPQPVPTGQKVTVQDGILVQEIEIQKGDTLYALSRKFSGRGMYFPQILLFNSINNPNLIYAGNILKVPVTQNETHESGQTETKPSDSSSKPKPKASKNKKTPAKRESHSSAKRTTGSSVSSPSTDLSLSDLKTVSTEKNKPSRTKKKAPVRAKKVASQSSSPETAPSSQLPSAVTTSVPVADADAGQKLFEAAVHAYRQDDCRTALELLDRYLADNPGSPLAADANLYKADCYLKLSAQ
jgi:LysM repeat protein